MPSRSLSVELIFKFWHPSDAQKPTAAELSELGMYLRHTERENSDHTQNTDRIVPCETRDRTMCTHVGS